MRGRTLTHPWSARITPWVVLTLVENSFLEIWLVHTKNVSTNQILASIFLPICRTKRSVLQVSQGWWVVLSYVAGWIGWRSGIILTPMLTHLADHFVYLFCDTTTSTLLVKVPCLVIAQIYSKENSYLERVESIILDPLDFSQ
jgi:hypothetical protein